MKNYFRILVTLCVLLLIVFALAGCTRAKTSDVLAPIAEAAGVNQEPGQAPGRAPALQGGTGIVFQPQNSTVGVGATTVVEVRVENVQNLYGADVRIGFDASKLEGVDANPGAAGVQIEPGPFLDPGAGFIAQNNVDNTAGRIAYAITLLNPAPAASGSGVLMRVTFKGKASGNSPLTFVSASLFNQSGNQINTTPQGGSVNVGGQAGPSPTPGTPQPSPTTGPSPTARPTSTPGPTATPGAQPPPAPTCIYTVRFGDTLNYIGRRYGTSAMAIALRNGIPNPNLIFPGQRLVIPNCGRPSPPPPPGQCFLYIVKPGEWLGMIGFRYGTTALRLAQINGIWNPNLIYPGQRLTVCR